MPTYTKTAWVNGGPPAIDSTNLNKIESGVFSAYDTAVVEVDSYSGTDEQKLTSAMAYAAAQTYKPTLRLSSRRWDFTTTRTLYTGFKITGSGYGGSVEQPRSGNPYGTYVKVSTGGGNPWLQVTSDVYGCYVGNMSVEGTSTSGFITSNGGTLWTSVLENLGFSAFSYVIGKTTSKLLMTACTFKGFWNINNSYGTAITIGGSDNTLWVDGCLLDSPPAFTGTSVPYHMWCDYLEKSVIGPMFITCEAVPAGIRVTGNSSNAALIFTGLKVEGRNAGSSSYGSVVRIEGGRTTFRDCWLSYGYSAPGSSTRSNEGGVVTALGGRTLFDGCWYARAGTDGVTETTPWIYASGSGTTVRVRNAQTGEDGGTFTAVPLVSAVSSATSDVDNSVRTS